MTGHERVGLVPYAGFVVRAYMPTGDRTPEWEDYTDWLRRRQLHHLSTRPHPLDTMAALSLAQESGGEWARYGLIPYAVRALESFIEPPRRRRGSSRGR